jgi:hypothetical protein
MPSLCTLPDSDDGLTLLILIDLKKEEFTVGGIEENEG